MRERTFASVHFRGILLIEFVGMKRMLEKRWRRIENAILLHRRKILEVNVVNLRHYTGRSVVYTLVNEEQVIFDAFESSEEPSCQGPRG